MKQNSKRPISDREELRRMVQAVQARLIYRLKDLEVVVGAKRTAIHAWIDAGQFPKPIKLGPRAKGWIASEIDEWLRARAAQRDNVAA